MGFPLLLGAGSRRENRFGHGRKQARIGRHVAGTVRNLNA